MHQCYVLPFIECGTVKIIPKNYSSIVFAARVAALPMDTFSEVCDLMLHELIKIQCSYVIMLLLLSIMMPDALTLSKIPLYLMLLYPILCLTGLLPGVDIFPQC